MPKSIKKRIRKKIDRQGEVINSSSVLIKKLKTDIDQNKKNLYIVLIVSLTVIITVSGIFIYRNYQSNKADQLNYEAYKLYNNINPGTVLPSNTGTPSKSDLSDILKDLKESYALKKSVVTLFYIANCYYDMGDMKQSEKTLLELNQRFGYDKYIIPLSYMKLYYIYRQTNDNKTAMDILNKLNSLDTPFYKDFCLFQMGKMFEADGRVKDAIARYEELVSKYAGSPYISQAQSDINQLKAAGQKPNKPAQEPVKNK